jgi:hypothetical protein
MEIVEFAYERGNMKTHHHLPFDQNVGYFSILKNLVASIQMDKATTIVLHNVNDPAMSLFEIQAKMIIDIGYDHLGSIGAIVLYVHALHL